MKDYTHKRRDQQGAPASTPSQPFDKKVGSDQPMPTGDSDLLVGARAIARFLYGDATQRRKVYYRAERGDIPHFLMGGTICSTRSALKRMMDRNLLEAISALEAA